MSITPSSSLQQIFASPLVPTLAIPLTAAVGISPPYTLTRKFQAWQQLGVRSPNLFDGLSPVLTQQLGRFALRTGPVPFMKSVVSENRPSWLNERMGNAFATVGTGTLADIALVPTERLATAQQSWGKELGTPKPSLASWYKSYSKPKLIKELWRGTSATAINKAPFWAALVASKDYFNSQLNPDDGSEPSLQDKLFVAGGAAATSTFVNAVLTPGAEAQQHMQKTGSSLTYRQALGKTFENGVRKAWRSTASRVAVTGLSSLFIAFVLIGQESHSRYVANLMD